MGILLKLKNANSDISVIIGDFKNLLSIFIVKSARLRLISFTSLTSLLATHVLIIKLGEQFDTTTVELDFRRTKLADHRRTFSVDSCMMCTFLE